MKADNPRHSHLENPDNTPSPLLALVPRRSEVGAEHGVQLGSEGPLVTGTAPRGRDAPVNTDASRVSQESPMS